MLKIGVLDSGVGGLNCLKALQTQFPFCKFFYIADRKNCPYGNKTTQQVVGFIDKLCYKLYFTYGVDAIVLACNTASTNALDYVRQKYPITIFGVVPPILKLAKNDKKILVLATENTIASKNILQQIEQVKSNAKIYRFACANLATLIEEEKYSFKKSVEYALKIINEYIKKYNIDSVILGCTHYVFLQKQLENECPQISFYNGYEELLEAVRDYLGFYFNSFNINLQKRK
ncbi:MAG: glutamate racemase [Clostridia bacterium]